MIKVSIEDLLRKGKPKKIDLPPEARARILKSFGAVKENLKIATISASYMDIDWLALQAGSSTSKVEPPNLGVSPKYLD